MMRQWPNRGADFVGFPFGENVADDLIVMRSGYAQRLLNMEYSYGTMRRRRPFVLRNTTRFSDIATGAVNYVDHAGQSRLVFTTNDGKIQEDDTTGYLERVTTLTAGNRGTFDQILGACFHQNGVDPAQRGDDSNWRVAGAPPALSGLTVLGEAGGAVTGTYLFMITACVEVDGVVILESDHSEYVNITVSSQRFTISWPSSPDPRVNLYRVYRTKNNQGTPFYLLDSTSGNSMESNITDADLSAQLSPPVGRNGEMPISRLIRRSGQRMVCADLLDAQDPDASKSVHVSAIAVTSYDAEYYPVDGVHRFRLPGRGKVTALFSYSVKDEDNASRDLFLAQEDSCFILRDTDPYGVLEPVSLIHGVVSYGAITQWGRYLFFVSKQGLMFLGEGGDPVLISQNVNPYFNGGGPLNIPANVGSEYIFLEVHDNRLLITLRDSSGAVWGNKTLVMDLERFSPGDPIKSAHFTTWNITGGGMALYVPMKDGTLALFDNKNLGILKFGTGYQDYVWTWGESELAMSGPAAAFLSDLRLSGYTSVEGLSGILRQDEGNPNAYIIEIIFDGETLVAIAEGSSGNNYSNTPVDDLSITESGGSGISGSVDVSALSAVDLSSPLEFSIAEPTEWTKVLIKAQIWSFGLMSQDSTALKVCHQVNLILKSGADSLMDLEGDYGTSKERNKVIQKTAQEIVWNKDWDKPWFKNNANFTSVYFSRGMKGRFFQAKILCENNSPEFVFVGLGIHYTASIARRMLKR